MSTHPKVIQILPDCSIWVHHRLIDSKERLYIDLSVKPKAEEKFPEKVDEIINGYITFFDNKITIENWEHSIDKNNKSRRYNFDVTNHPIDSILAILDQLKRHFG